MDGSKNVGVGHVTPMYSVAYGSFVGVSAGLLTSLIARKHLRADGSNSRYKSLGFVVLGAMWGGGYIGTHNFLAKKRGVEDVVNSIGAGCLVGVTVGLACPVRPLARVVPAAGFTALMVAAAFPIYSQYKKIPMYYQYQKIKDESS